MADIDAILEKLENYSTEDALVVLDAISEDRKEKHFAKYWSCDPNPEYQQFFDSIADSFAKFTSDIKIYAMLGGNRSSKTERGAFLSVAWLFGKEYFSGVGCRKLEENAVGASRKRIASKVDGVNSR